MKTNSKNARAVSLHHNFTGYHTAEYLLILSPHEDLWNTIMTIKSDFASKYDHPMAAYTKPHLTLLKFLQLEVTEDRIVKHLKSICSSQPLIKIELKDFHHFPSHTIYINVTSKLPILNLVKALKEAQPLLKFDPNFKPFFITEPHVTIARQLVPWQYEKAWNEFSHSSFTGRFIADKMTLLKRRVGNKSYQIVKEFPFHHLPQIDRQGSLFIQ